MTEKHEAAKVECSACGDTGIEFLRCCDGSMCGCLGYPVQATNCGCGAKPDESKLGDYDRELLGNMEWIGHD